MKSCVLIKRKLTKALGQFLEITQGSWFDVYNNDALHSAKNFDLLIFTFQFCPKSNLIKIPVLGLDIVETF